MTIAGVAAPAGQDLLERLLDAGSSFGRQIADAAELPLGTYLCQLYSDLPPTNASAMRHLLTGLGRVLEATGCEDVSAVCDEFYARPVIQQADHANLLLDTETFLNNLLFHVAAAESRATYAITSQCTTVVCFSRRIPPTGPVFLATRGALWNVFGRSKNEYRRSSFVGLTGPVEVVLAPLRQDSPAGDDPVLERMRGRRFENAAQCYRVLNDEVWSGLDVNQSVCRIQVDESMTSLVIAEHLRDPASPINRLFFEREVRTAFRTAKQAAVASHRNLAINRATPEWLWVRRGSRLLAVDHLDNDGTARLEDGTPLGIPWTPAALAGALEHGEIYGDRVVSYLARSILPGAVAVGGTVQQDYVQTYVDILREADRVVPFLDDGVVASMSHPSISRLGGAPLIELGSREHELFDWLGPASDLKAWLATTLARTVGSTVGALSCAWFYDHLLGRAACRRAASGRGM